MKPEFNFVINYFTEERAQSVILLSIGIIALILACIFFYIIRYSFFKGIAIPLLLIGLLQIVVGGVIFYRSPKDTLKVQNMFLHEPHRIKSEELPRIEKVIKQFEIYKWIEMTLLIISIILIVIFYNSPQTFWKGIGLGLLLQTCLVFGIDIMSEKRALDYKENILHYNNNINILSIIRVM